VAKQPWSTPRVNPFLWSADERLRLYHGAVFFHVFFACEQVDQQPQSSDHIQHGKNPLSEWGRAEAPAIRTKGIRDYAYLVIKKKAEPMHFSDVAKSISSVFAKKAHVATTHNELIKDSRFVLVGRGLYALAEWGYQPGVVRDVIKEVLKKKPLTREEVIEEVKKVRYVKDNTVLVNLNDTKHFKRSKDGKYSLI
jgi:hypothetical protein